jgi:hypothetical protein
VRYLRRGEHHLAARFLDEHWAKDHIYVRSPDLFDWSFDRPALWDHDGYSFAIAENDAGIVGVLGAIPMVFNDHGRRSLGLYMANWMVRPEHRGVIGVALMQVFARPPFEQQYSFGINTEVTRVYRALGWHILRRIPRHVLVLPGAGPRVEAFLRLADPLLSADQARGLVDAFGRPVDVRVSRYEHALPSSWDDVTWTHLRTELVGAARDAEFLDWRYRRHPTFRYRFIACADGDLTGLAVWRLETIRRREGPTLIDVDRVARVVEFLPVSEPNARALLAGLVAEIAGADAMFADFYGYHGETADRLDALGFRRTEHHPEGDRIPSRFQPLEAGGGQIMSAVATKLAPPGEDAGGRAWYWTKGDSDQDRPN